MRQIITLVPVAIVLAGCATTTAITCGPPLKQYSKEFQSAASEEYKAIEPTAPHIVQMVDDYGVSREASRACLKLRK